MNPTSGPNILKENVAVVLTAKPLSLVFYSVEAGVYTEIVPECARKTLQAIIRGKVEPESIMHSDSWRG